MSAAKPGAHFQSHRAGHVRQCPTLQSIQHGNLGNFGVPVPPAWAPGPSTSQFPASQPRGSVIAYARRKWYAVFEPAAARGVYRVWEQVKQLVTGQPNAVHKGFPSEAAALEWISYLNGRAKEESDAVEHLRRMILGPNYRVGGPAALVPASCRPVADLSSSGSHVDTCSSTEAVHLAGAAEPRPWETSPIVLSVPTSPSREYYRKWYAVRFVEGGSPGVYNTWQEAEGAISGRYAEHRSFDSQAEALMYAFGPEYAQQLLPPVPVPAALSPQPMPLEQQQPSLHQPQLGLLADAAISTDGASASGGRAAAADVHGDATSHDPLGFQRYSTHYFPDGYEQPYFGELSSYGGYGGDGLFAEVFADIYPQPPPLVQASFTSFRAPALAAGDAAAVRPPPVNPGGVAVNVRQRAPELPSGAGGRSCPAGGSSGGSGGVGLPVPPVAAMAAPVSYDTPYSGHVAVMVLPSAPTPASPAIVPSPVSSSPQWVCPPCTAGRLWSAPSRNPQQQGACTASPAINASSRGLGGVSVPSGSRGWSVIAQAGGSGSGPSDAGSGPHGVGGQSVGHNGGSLRAEPSPDGLRTGGEAAATAAVSDAGLGWAAAAVEQAGGLADALASVVPPHEASLEASPQPSARATEAAEGLQEQKALAPAAEPAKRRRGRPRKSGTVPLPDSDIGTAAGGVAAGGNDTPKRPRGGPPKAATPGSRPADVPKRSRGRPPKAAGAMSRKAVEGPKRPRGRPPKAGAAEGATVTEGARRSSRERPRKTKGAEEPMDAVKRPRGRPKNVTSVPMYGDWTMVEFGSGRLDPNQPYIMVFQVSQPDPHPFLQAASAAASTSVEPASAASSPKNSRGYRSRVLYSMVLLSGEDKTVIGTKAGEATCSHPAEVACGALAFCLRDAKKRGLTRVMVMGTGLTGLASQRLQHQAGEEAHGGLSKEGGDPGWSLLDEQSLPPAVRLQQAAVIGRLTQTAAVELLRLPEASDRDALLSLAARAPELQKTVARLLGEWRPQKALFATFKLCLDAEEELQRLRRVNRGGADGPAGPVTSDALEPSTVVEDVTEGFLERLFVETSCMGETLEERLHRAFTVKVLVQALLPGMGRVG